MDPSIRSDDEKDLKRLLWVSAGVGFLLNLLGLFFRGFYVLETPAVHRFMVLPALVGVLFFFLPRRLFGAWLIAGSSLAFIVWFAVCTVITFSPYPQAPTYVRLLGSAVRLRFLISEESLMQCRKGIQPQTDEALLQFQRQDWQSRIKVLPVEIQDMIVNRKTRRMLFRFQPAYLSDPNCWQLDMFFDYGAGPRIMVVSLECSDAYVPTNFLYFRVREGLWVYFPRFEGGSMSFL